MLAGSGSAGLLCGHNLIGTSSPSHMQMKKRWLCLREWIDTKTAGWEEHRRDGGKITVPIRDCWIGGSELLDCCVSMTLLVPLPPHTGKGEMAVQE